MSIKLVAPEGATAASFDGQEYVVANGIVEVPDEAALTLYAFGFTNAPADDNGKGKKAKA